MLESAKHAGSCFVTLTYNQLTLPFGSTLVPEDPRNWLKRLRQAVYPHKLRYFIVGEYGDHTHRPHYHAAIFGLDPLLGGGLDGRRGLVAITWKNGYSVVGDLSAKSAGYICGYVTKKMTKRSDPRLKGRYPEFARMSLKPGIGAHAMEDVAGVSELFHSRTGDLVPHELGVGRKRWPLGRYLRSILRQQMGYGRKTTDQEAIDYGTKMRILYEQEKETSTGPEILKRNVDTIFQKALNAEKKFKIHEKRGEL